VLGPLLFLIYINDLDAVVSIADWLLKFADDTKAARVANSEGDRLALQRALNSLVNWSETWGMRFDVKKCKVMHLGRRNAKHDYVMAGAVLEKTREEKDLGVLISDNLKPADQCAQIAKTAQIVLGQISRAFQYRDKKVLVQLYKQYVRPHLEFAVQAWSPSSMADIDTLEKVQKRAVGMVSGLRNQDYAARLKELDLTTLAERRHQADMLMMYKLLHGHGQLGDENWFTAPPPPAARMRRHADSLNVRPNHGRLELRRNAFSVHTGEPWNAVPPEIKRARSADAFKRQYSKYRNGMI
jgi:Reverse transcriptase (RNA-dependent DNA polymerase)